MARLENKVALVTGGSRGIGAAIARRLGEEGAAIAIVYRTDSAAADAVVGHITAAGGIAAAFQCDVARPSEIVTMVAAALAEFGGIDILVNNAGIYLLNVPGETSEEIWDSQIDTNLKGVFFTAQAVLPQMKARGGGKIINIGSICGETAMLSSAIYCASKGGIKLLTKALALDLRADNIQVNSLSPGCVESDMNAGYRAEGDSFMEQLQSRFGPGDPWMNPDDMAGTALFLASSDSDRVTGANIMVDHGYSAY